MVQKLRLSLFIGLLISFGYAQKNKLKAEKLVKQATELINNGDVKAALPVLENANSLAPHNPDVLYQLAYANYLSGNYEKSVETLQNATTTSEVTENHYQLLGNSYDQLGIKDSAMIAYNQGIEKFPASGKLYYESGLLKYNTEKYNEAIDFWEKGIKAAPQYAGNYYELTRIFSHSDEKLWALIYGELFMNMEKESTRTAEISKLLYNTFDEVFVKHESKGAERVLTQKGFENGQSRKVNTGDMKNNPANFEGSYVSLLCKAASRFVTSSISLDQIYKTRKEFLEQWFANASAHTKYTNALIDWQQKLYDQGCFEAYTYWLFSEGNYNEFSRWLNTHKADYNKFMEFTGENKLMIKTSETYTRPDYMVVSK